MFGSIIGIFSKNVPMVFQDKSTNIGIMLEHDWKYKKFPMKHTHWIFPP